MKINHLPLTLAQYEAICGQSANWEIKDMRMNTLMAVPKLVRPSQVIGGFISGALNDPKTLNGHPAVAAFDVITEEPNPQTWKGEANVNAYHFVIQQTHRNDFPFILHGPYRDETLIGHWPTGLALEVYQN